MNTNNNTSTTIFKIAKGWYKVYHKVHTNVCLEYTIKHELNGHAIYNDNRLMASVATKDDAIRCIQMATPSNLSR
jgi:hypothetical protein